MITFFLCSWVALAADILLFNALYFGMVLLRVRNSGLKVNGSVLLNSTRQEGYVKQYLGLLTVQERSRWYNIYLEHSLTITVALIVVATLSLTLPLLVSAR